MNEYRRSYSPTPGIYGRGGIYQRSYHVRTLCQLPSVPAALDDAEYNPQPLT